MGYDKRVYRERVEKGLCTDCGWAVTGEHRLCEGCRARRLVVAYTDPEERQAPYRAADLVEPRFRPLLSGWHRQPPPNPTQHTVQHTRDELRAALGVRPWNRVRCEPGSTFGRLTVTRLDPPDGNNNGSWCVCRCECGQMRRVLAWRLVHAAKCGQALACHRCAQLQRLKARGHRIRMAAGY